MRLATGGVVTADTMRTYDRLMAGLDARAAAIITKRGPALEAACKLPEAAPTRCHCGRLDKNHAIPCAAPVPERVPVAGWVRVGANRWVLTIGHLRAAVIVLDSGIVWRVAVYFGSGTGGESILASNDEPDATATSVAPAQLAAEDALHEIAAQVADALGFELRRR